jgi:hypothetical protein
LYVHVAKSLVESTLEPVNGVPSSSVGVQFMPRLNLAGEAVATVTAATITEMRENRMLCVDVGKGRY